MYKVGVCGHFGDMQNLLNGQTVKTKIITEELKKHFGTQLVSTIDTYGWRKNPIALLYKCYLLIKNCENVIIMPAYNGVKVFVPLFSRLNKVFHRKLNYVVIGGWLPELLENNIRLLDELKEFEAIYVETNSMVIALNKLGLINVQYLPNFKRLDIINESELIFSKEGPYKLCTFSRVMKEKGIEDAINVVKSVNDSLGKIVYILDIYGQIDENYKNRFEGLIEEFPSYISYKGIVNYSDSVNVLKNYFSLLFPTYYVGEGFAGTILDAFSAGIPVIASDWKYNREIIHDKLDGFIFECHNIEKLKSILLEIYQDPNIILKMKINCLERAKEYKPENVINKLIEYLY